MSIHLAADNMPGTSLCRYYFCNWINMGEILFQPAAQVVQSRFTDRCPDKSILGTFTMAHGKMFTIPAVLRQPILFIKTEFLLLLRKNSCVQFSLLDIAQMIFGVDKMVAGINLAVVF